MDNPGTNHAGGHLVFMTIGFVSLVLFGFGESALRTAWDVGFSAGDGLRVVVGAAVIATGFSCGASAIDRVVRWFRPGELGAAALVLLGPLLVGVGLLSTEESLEADDLFPAVAGSAAAAYLFWKSGQFNKLSAGVAGPCFAAASSLMVLLPAQYGADRWELNGLPVTMLALALIPMAVSVGAFVSTDVAARSRRVQSAVCFAVSVMLVGLAAALPHVFPGVIFYLKLSALALAAAGTASIVVPLVHLRPKTIRSGLVAAGVVLVGAIGWSHAQLVSDRFGALGFDSVAGIGAAFVSLPEDRDGDGFYREGVPVIDCDDADPNVYPASPQAPCLRVELSVSPSTDDTWHEEPKHVIVVLSDALRARDVYDSEVMPWVAAPRPGRIAFARAYSPGNTTRLSVRPMFTGVSPPRFVLDQSAELRPESWFFGNLGPDFAPRWIVASEFAWMHRADQWTGESSVDQFIGELDEKGRNIDLAVDAAIEHLDSLESGKRAAIGLFSTDPHADYLCDDGTQGSVRCYREELRALDRALERLFSELQKRGVHDETLVVLTSDHGEELGEHGHFGQHASTLYEEQIHVPFVFWYRALPSAQVHQPVSTLSTLPTLADIMGTELAFPRAEGSLLPAMLGRVTGTPAPMSHHWTGLVLGVGVRRSVIVRDHSKLEYDWRTGHMRFVDLVDDPDEIRNSVVQNRDRAEGLLELMHRRQTEAAKLSGFAFLP